MRKLTDLMREQLEMMRTEVTENYREEIAESVEKIIRYVVEEDKEDFIFEDFFEEMAESDANWERAKVSKWFANMLLDNTAVCKQRVYDSLWSNEELFYDVNELAEEAYKLEVIVALESIFDCLSVYSVMAYLKDLGYVMIEQDLIDEIDNGIWKHRPFTMEELFEEALEELGYTEETCGMKGEK